MFFSRYTTIIIICLLALGILRIKAQNQVNNNYFSSPLNIPLFLSGNFGELRSAHFHSGIDFKTQQAKGKPVFASADGYVSRIKIQTGGYGKSVYIIHSNGLTTVYAHFKDFIPEIAEYVKDYQYKNKSYEIDMYIPADKFIVKKNNLIGFSGNTGNSGGPHLHFEIRNSAQQPLNVLLYKFDIADNIKPVIENIIIYPLNDESTVNGKSSKLILKPVKKQGDYLLNESPVHVSGSIGFGIEADDYLNGSNNKCSVYSIELLIDDTIYYYHEMESFSFNEVGYVKSHIDYEERILNNRDIHKLYVETNNRLSIYKTLKNNGIVHFIDDTVHSIKMTVKDVYKNTSVLDFKVKSDSFKPSVFAVNSDSSFIRIFYYYKINTYENPDFKITIPENALFKNINFKYSRYSEPSSVYSDIHLVHSETIPLYKPFELSLKVKNLPENLNNKALIVTLNQKNKPVSLGGEYNDGFVTSKSEYFGKFWLMVDTLAPQISPIYFMNNKLYNNADTISFKIEDDLSGIKSYNGYIDKRWALFEYDPKINTIFYVIDPLRLEAIKMHELEIKIVDEKENINIFKGSFKTN